MYSHPWAYALATRVMARLGNLIPESAPMMRQWTSVRTKPKFAGKTLHELAREKGFDHE
jgi:L-lactate dehydrogenase complex protein LldF